MTAKKLLTALTMTALLGACNTVGASRNAPLEQIPTATSPVTAGIKSSQSETWHIQDVRVRVASSLSVSEANLYLPKGDIVWREDPFGDRRKQVETIIDLAISQAAIGLQGTAPVYLDIELVRFHALSQKARATVGGVHNISFVVGVYDVETNVELIDRFPVDIKLKALGGQKAIDAEMRGETQKVRITREVTSVMRHYLGT